MSTANAIGRAFADALTHKSWSTIEAILHPEVDFRAMTPKQMWEARGNTEVIAHALKSWFRDEDRVDALVSCDVRQLIDRYHLRYRLEVWRADDGPCQIEQQIYFEVDDDRIKWMRVLCSGFRPLSCVVRPAA